jgi:hypothetical protein
MALFSIVSLLLAIAEQRHKKSKLYNQKVCLMAAGDSLEQHLYRPGL